MRTIESTSASPAREHEAPEGPVRRAAPAARCFDGVVCFGGEDWWYHNRGHYDMQMMRELSRRVDVLYINSIGMRLPRPSEGGMFARRIARKARSLSRGLRRVRPGFAVMSPVAAPGGGGRFGGSLLSSQVSLAARALGMRRPLAWVACPPAAGALGRLGAAGLVYQRTDRFESFDGVDRERIGSLDRSLKADADLTLFCSRHLFDAEAPACRSAAFVDHGVDYERFVEAGDGRVPEPEDVAGLPRPRVGFVGGIDAHTFDPALFDAVAARLPDFQFVLVGACSLPEGWCRRPNVRFMGQRDYGDVAAYMAACDVLIMPWNRNDWIRACNPVKLKEYLAVGRPVVSTPFPELGGYAGLVRVGADADSFAAEIRDAVARGCDAGAQRRRVAGSTWDARADAVVELLAERGLEPAAPARTTG